MRDVLKRNSSIGNIQGILLFESKLFDENVTSLDAFKDIDKFELGIQINVPVAIAFFEYLELINVKNKKITLSAKGKELVQKNTLQRNIFICSTILQKAINENLININNIHISHETGEIVLDSNAFSLSSAIFRNFLISAKCLSSNNAGFIVDGIYESELKAFAIHKRKIVSQEELLKQLEKERDDGALAEQLVMNYEKERLPNRSSKIKQVSLIDVAAGYDILSFNSESSLLYDRFIEVKCFHGKAHFYWSSNEKNISELIGENYFIYLVDLDRYFCNPEGFKPTIIQNPSKNINSENWCIEPTNFYVYRISDAE